MLCQHVPRRRFLARTALAGVALAAFGPVRLARSAAPAASRVLLGVMGINGRGNALARGFAACPGVEIAYLCDVDERTFAKTTGALAAGQPRAPKTVKDFRRILEDREVDALAIGAPDHWHGPATILACSAGKHVYVEKPASHNPQEGEWMVAAARKHRRVVQVGMQRRSMPAVIEAIGKVRSGALGRVLFARSWYNATRSSIGRGRRSPAPAWLDYPLWQGPAPERPYQDNLVHYNWHWFWHWGTGELGNNGVHGLDLCRWGLNVDYPRKIAAGGGRYHFRDDQETPDTLVATFDFGDKAIAWEGRSCQRHGYEGSMFGAAFYGEAGTLIIDGSGYRLFDPQDKEVGRFPGPDSDAPHFQNFLDCIRQGGLPVADVEEGHKSALLCHLGNLAYRAGATLSADPANGHIAEPRSARAGWRREYRPGWTPRV